MRPCGRPSRLRVPRLAAAAFAVVVALLLQHLDDAGAAAAAGDGAQQWPTSKYNGRGSRARLRNGEGLGTGLSRRYRGGSRGEGATKRLLLRSSRVRGVARGSSRRKNWLWVHSKLKKESDVPSGRIHRCSGGMEGSWNNETEEWTQRSEYKCKLIEQSSIPDKKVMQCLNGKVIAFVGDSHVRNSYRCLADMLTGGASASATGFYSEAWNDPEEPESWPKYSHIHLDGGSAGSVQTNSSSGATRGPRVPKELMHIHELSCRNHYKVHRHDYSFAVQGPGGTSVRLNFYWQPWGGDKPLLDTVDAVDQMGLAAAAYRFNYTGSRARSTFVPALSTLKKDKPHLVVAGGEARDHSALFSSFPGSAIILNHSGNPDRLVETAAAHEIPVADITAALIARQGDFWDPLDAGRHGIPRVRHPAPEVLEAQTKVLLTLAADLVCHSP